MNFLLQLQYRCENSLQVIDICLKQEYDLFMAYANNIQGVFLCQDHENAVKCAIYR